MDVSIVIPTKNGGKLFRQVLDMVFRQETDYSYEVICVDSGSRDETLRIIREYPCALYQILPEEFGHGKTRNFGASKGTGTYIVFLTQDALPAGVFWLQNLIRAMEKDQDIAGGFGKHLPYPGCNVFDVRDLTLHFENFGKKDTIYFLGDRERYAREEGYRHMLAFFSDNNACLRRSIWEVYPYADVEFAEDQIWMRKMIEAGYKKVYCPLAAVYHSHDYDVRTFYQRYYDEHKGLYQLHGYEVAGSWSELFVRWMRHVRMDINYLRTLSMGGKEKLRWTIYSIRRNYARYYGGYKGSKYHTYSPDKQKRLDKKLSQQYRQRKA
ncbi:glycosyltransferase family 2 protein [Suipraeoptans intestinalis]|uniref:glycosyltransferase family 2 protein n=1 Tax=Suipraeoptans intestinalis TaxID=2606628 RepID=UPI0023F1F33F|nr:glycosyltransferase family 2 protein [Suipraeoptans intestinalis]MDD7770544.1 glycosyltransferase family 2 protein [Suipraeoptans intestinalis]MDY3122747.1 glycosyltransferase family 2 protein [Suipraeoptans intestinalis]